MAFNKKVKVKSNEQAGPGLFIMELNFPELADACKPGQFVHVLVSDQADPLLRRPISLFDADKNTGIIRLLYKVAGQGTLLMTRKRPEDTIDIVGPLGRGFTLRKEEKVMLVGGGVGIAPLVYLARTLQEQDCQVQVLHGVNTKNQLIVNSYLGDLGISVLSATLDGSAGYKGSVVGLLNEQIKPQQYQYIYTCGPDPMMAAVAEYACRFDIPGEVSLEEHMACGVGACLGCARKLRSKDVNLVKVCKDGPVFDMTAVEF